MSYFGVIAIGINKNHYKTDIHQNLAVELGNNFDILKPVYLKLKNSISTDKRQVRYRFPKNTDPVTINKVTSFLSKCDRSHMLAEYKYKSTKNDKLISIKPSKIAENINFYTGDWLEMYLSYYAEKILRKNNIFCSKIENLIVVLEDGQKFEIDSVLLSKTGKIYILESKTGLLGDSAFKYSKIKNHLGLDKNQVIVISIDQDKNALIELEELYDITICNLIDFEIYFSECVKNTFPMFHGDLGKLAS